VGLAHACSWIETQLPLFALGAGELGARMAMIKALGDLAHGGDVIERMPDRTYAARGTTWLDFAHGELAGGEHIRQLIAVNPMYAPAAVTFLPFELSGRGNPRLTATLAEQVRRADLPPLAWTMLVPTLELYGITPTTMMRVAARRTSILANETEAAVMPFDAAYVLAHECMYATRWGRAAPEWDDRTDTYARRVLPALAERATAAGDADLLAEVALAHHAITGDALDIWDALATAQTPAGNVEPPAQLVTMFPRLPHPRLTRTYHTTLVAIMAWAVRDRPAVS
jgi:hypothetical protein